MPADTDLRGAPVAYLHIPPGDTTRTFVRVRGARGGKSRVVVTGFAAEGESYRVISPILDGRYVYWLQQDRDPQRVLRRPGERDPAARRWSSRNRLFPGAVDSIAVARDAALLHERPGPLPGDRPRPARARGLTAD